jgi:hypothetical protein
MKLELYAGRVVFGSTVYHIRVKQYGLAWYTFDRFRFFKVYDTGSLFLPFQ